MKTLKSYKRSKQHLDKNQRELYRKLDLMLLPFIPRAFITSIVLKDELAYAELCDSLGYSVTDNRNAISLLIEYNDTYQEEYIQEEIRQKKEQKAEALKRISNRDRQELLREAFETIAAVMSATEGQE